ncbi:MAG: putative PEP-binding protein, partial [Acetobacteraceae bacterium]
GAAFIFPHLGRPERFLNIIAYPNTSSPLVWDFLAIGTNDLSMYTLAVDRGAAELAGLYDPLHPAVLRLVQFATEAGLRMRKPVSVCGEMGANPAFTALLLGLGLRRFSISAPAVPRVKQAVRAASIEGAVRLARRVMDESDPARIRAHLASAQGGSIPG